MTHSFTPTVPGQKSEDELVENIGHVSELLRQGHIYLPAGSKRSDHCCLIHMYQFDVGLNVKCQALLVLGEKVVGGRLTHPTLACFLL